MDFLRIKDVSHTYFTPSTYAAALDDINLTVDEGEFISFLGPSGCGKSTLLSIIAGLIKPTEGSVLLEGKKVDRKQNDIGYMLQQDYLFPWKTIEENILLGLKITGKLDQSSRETALVLLGQMGLGKVEAHFPDQLSGGMRQRVALVRTLASEPKLLMLDEPFSALDFQTKLRLEDLVSETLKQLNKTAILVTHDIGEAIAMSGRIILFSPGPGRIHRIIQVPDELKLLSPFDARNHPAYNSLFQLIWKEIESLESTT